MASDRDTLADLLKETADRASSFQFHIGHYRGVAAQVLAAGWRPPAHEITDPDTPDTYPARTVGIDRDGEVWVSRFSDWVVAFDPTARGERLGDIVADVGPLTLVFIPTEEATGE